MSGISSASWEQLIDTTKFERVVDDGSGSDVFDSDIPEDRVYYPYVVIISDTSGSANTATIDKVGEDGDTETIHSFNVPEDETLVYESSDLGVILPRLEGGTNLSVTADSDGIELTVFYFPNEV